MYVSSFHIDELSRSRLCLFLFLSLAMIVFSSGCLFLLYYFRFLLCFYKMIDFSSVCESFLSLGLIFEFFLPVCVFDLTLYPFARRDKLFSDKFFL